MTTKLENQFCEFAYNIGKATGFVDQAINGDDEIKSEFASRGISTEKLQQAAEAMKDVSNVFYNVPLPV